jgi:hypothetical protein
LITIIVIFVSKQQGNTTELAWNNIVKGRDEMSACIGSTVEPNRSFSPSHTYPLAPPVIGSIHYGNFILWNRLLEWNNYSYGIVIFFLFGRNLFIGIARNMIHSPFYLHVLVRGSHAPPLTKPSSAPLDVVATDFWVFFFSCCLVFYCLSYAFL